MLLETFSSFINSFENSRNILITYGKINKSKIAKLKDFEDFTCHSQFQTFCKCKKEISFSFDLINVIYLYDNDWVI